MPRFVSVAKWPYPAINLGNENNESRDEHATREQAHAVCRMLERDGFGGNCEFYPISTRVEELES